jgi:hypothetical protein
VIIPEVIEVAPVLEAKKLAVDGFPGTVLGLTAEAMDTLKDSMLNTVAIITSTQLRIFTPTPYRPCDLG